MSKQCVICGSTENLVHHHISYNPEEIVFLCRSCHGKVHASPDAPTPPPNFYTGVVAATRVPEPMSELMERYVERGTYLSESEFIRQAIREKLERDVPAWLKALLFPSKGEPKK